MSIYKIKIFNFIDNRLPCETYRAMAMITHNILEQAQSLKPYDKLTLIEELLKTLDDVWFLEAENRFKTCQKERTKSTSNAFID